MVVYLTIRFVFCNWRKIHSIKMYLDARFVFSRSKYIEKIESGLWFRKLYFCVAVLSEMLKNLRLRYSIFFTFLTTSPIYKNLIMILIKLALTYIFRSFPRKLDLASFMPEFFPKRNIMPFWKNEWHKREPCRSQKCG